MGASPPSPKCENSTTDAASMVATPASTALPPLKYMRMPASVAYSVPPATAPRVPREARRTRRSEFRGCPQPIVHTNSNVTASLSVIMLLPLYGMYRRRRDSSTQQFNPAGSTPRRGGPLSQHFAHQSYRRQHGRRVKRRLVVVILVEQRSANTRADDAGHAPRHEQHAVINAGVPGAPEVRCGGAVHRELRPVAPVDDEHRQVQRGDVAPGRVQRRHGDD